MANKLNEWMKRESVLGKELSEASGIVESRISLLRNGLRTPTLKEALAIARVSKGAVSVESWDDNHSGGGDHQSPEVAAE